MSRMKMLKTTPGSPDGITVIGFKKDQVYEIPDELASVFLDMGVAVEANNAEDFMEIGKKSMAQAPENKIVKTKPKVTDVGDKVIKKGRRNK